jgi:hypothetical protein
VFALTDPVKVPKLIVAAPRRAYPERNTILAIDKGTATTVLHLAAVFHLDSFSSSQADGTF